MSNVSTVKPYDNNEGSRLVQFPLTIILIRIKETITTPVGW